MSAQEQDVKAILAETASRLPEVVVRLAGRLRPFPAFLDMSTVQAIELGLTRPVGDLGCVVVLSDGEICELELKMIPGPGSPSDVDQIGEFRELNVPPAQYILYAATAIGLLYEELRRNEQF